MPPSALMPPPLAAAGSGIFIVIVIVILIASTLVLYTRRGSDIAQRPIGPEKGDQPGVGEGASRISASEHDADESAERQPPH